MNKTGTLFILLSMICLFGHAQFSINGTVKDRSNHQVLPGASVRLENTTIATSSSQNGTFLLQLVKKGHYQLKISYMGYTPVVQEIDVKGDLQIDILLDAATIISEEVVISGTRVPVNAPATLTYVTKEEIASANTGQDLPFMLSGIPSAVVTSDAGAGIGYTGIRIRGTDMTRINVTVNGIPYNDPESHEVYWVDLPDIAASVDNIEIQRGVGTSSNGAASFGGSINIQTEKSSPHPYAEIAASAGSFNSFRQAVSLGSGLLKNKFSIDGRLSLISSDGYIDRATSDLKSFFISATWFGKRSMLKAIVFSGKERTYQAWDGIPKAVLDTNRTFNVNGLYIDNEGKLRFYRDEVEKSNPFPNWNTDDYLKWRENLANAGVEREYRVEQPYNVKARTVTFSLFLESGLQDIIDKPVRSFGEVIGKVIDYDTVSGMTFLEISKKFDYQKLDGTRFKYENLHGLSID